MAELFPLRPLQVRAIDGLRASLRAGKRRPIIQASTGFGKTVVAAHIVSGALAKRNRVAFCCPTISLIGQSFDRFVKNGIEPSEIGVMQANHSWTRGHAPLQICSAQTLAARGVPEVTFVVVDEAHIGFEVVDKWMDESPDKIFVGLTASPWRKRMGDRWDDLIRPSSLPELTELGWLTPIKGYRPYVPDMSDVKLVAGEYHMGQAAAKMSGKSIVGDVVSTWIERAENRPTLVFAVDRAHARLIESEFGEANIVMAYVDANTEVDEREAIFKQLRRGEIAGIVSIGTMIVGIDEDIRCICWARPTKSDMLFVQAMGRGMRPAAGKANMILLDHAGTTLELGLPEEIEARHTTLHTSKQEAAEKAEGKERELKLVTPIECPQCRVLIPIKATECPGCGFKPQRVCTVEVMEGELVEIGGSKKAPKGKFSKLEFYSQLKGYAQEQGYKSNWPLAKFRAKTGEWPHASIKTCAPAICSPKVRSWIRSEQIRWAKGQQRRSSDDRGMSHAG